MFEEFDEIMETWGEEEFPCIMCNAPTRNFGIFVPDLDTEGRDWGIPEGKKRYIGYHLCGKCYDDTDDEADLFEEVEEILWSMMDSVTPVSL